MAQLAEMIASQAFDRTRNALSARVPCVSMIRDRTSKLEEAMSFVIPTATLDRNSLTDDLAYVYAHLSHLQDLYPGFENWYWRTVVSNVGATRRIFVDEHDGRIKGIVIAKRGPDERKLCTVWVETPYRGNAVGARLMTRAMEWMDCRLPLISVPASRMPEFRAFFRRHKFVEAQRLVDYYRIGESEYVFNGSLPVGR